MAVHYLALSYPLIGENTGRMAELTELVYEVDDDLELYHPDVKAETSIDHREPFHSEDNPGGHAYTITLRTNNKGTLRHLLAATSDIIEHITSERPIIIGGSEAAIPIVNSYLNYFHTKKKK